MSKALTRYYPFRCLLVGILSAFLLIPAPVLAQGFEFGEDEAEPVTEEEEDGDGMTFTSDDMSKEDKVEEKVPNVAIVAIPMMVMMVMPAWAMTYDLIVNWIPARKYPLIAFGFTILGLQAWMIVEGVVLYRKIRGVEEPRAELPPGFKKRALASGT